MDVMCRRKAEGKLNDEQIIEEYEKIIEVLEENITNSKNAAQAEQTKASVEEKLSSCVKVDCDFVDRTLGPKFKANPSDLKLAKKIFALMISGKCTSNPLFAEANQAIIKVEPSYGGFKIQGILSKANKDWSKVIENFEKAAELAPGEKEKADAYLEIATAHRFKGSNESARSMARKAIATSASAASTGYELIGDLYFGSGSECKGDNPVMSRAVYMAAYDMYERAGNKAKMSDAAAQFPSIEEIFTNNFTEGQTITTGCWVGESTKVRKRK
jgi:tetratricopeptide (TPR) repeat protein